jgi:hypothetical protein
MFSDKLFSVPPHVAIDILVNIDNVIELYNFANVSKRSRDFVEKYDIYNRWNQKWFGPNAKICSSVVNSLDNLTQTGANYIWFNNQSLGVTIYEWHNVFEFIVDFGRLVSAMVNKLRKSVLSSFTIEIEDAELIQGSLSSPTQVARFCYMFFEFCNIHGLNVDRKEEEELGVNDFMAFHLCLASISNGYSDIQVMSVKDVNSISVIDGARIPELFKAYRKRLKEWLDEKIRLRFVNGPRNVTFVNNCIVCGTCNNVKHCCSWCQKPLHEQCWDSSNHENNCSKK